MPTNPSEQNNKYISNAYLNTDTTSDFSVDTSQTIHILFWAKLIFRHWWLFVIAGAIAVGAALVCNLSWTPEYQNEARVIVGANTNNSGYAFMQGFGDMSYTQINNQLLILGSYDIIDRTITRLPFSVDYYLRGRFRTNSLYGHEPVRIITSYVAPEAYGLEFRFTPIDDNTFSITLDDDRSKDLYPDFQIQGNYSTPIENSLFFATVEKLYLPTSKSSFFFRFRDLASLEAEFSSRLHISYIGEESTVVSVSLVGSSPNRDRDFLNALCEEYLASNLEEKNEEARRTIDFINSQLLFIADSLHTSEARLQQFRRENNMVDINGYTNTILTKLTSLDQQRSAINLKDRYFKELSSYLQSAVNTEKLVAPSSIGVSDPVLLDLVTQYNAIQQKRNDVGEKNPNYAHYSRQLDQTRETLLSVLDNVRRIHKLERQAFETEYNDALSELSALPAQELKMLSYERTYKINDNYYTFLLQKQSEAQIRKASNVPDNKILQRARTNFAPVNSNERMLTYFVFVAVAFIIVLLVIVVRELANNVIRDHVDIKSITSIPVIGEIYHTSKTEPVVSTRSPKSVYSEGYRRLRTRLEFITMRKSNVTILVSSAMSGDGKSHFAANFAGIYSLLDKRVLLMDVDMRNPMLSRNLGFEKNKGLTNALIGECDVHDLIVRGSDQFRFDFLPLGVVPPNPSELLNSDVMRTLLETLKAEYDFVIIDSSPLGLVADAYAMISSTDVNLVVARTQVTSKSAFRSFMNQLVLDDVHNTYIILNDVPYVKNNLRGKYYGRSFSYYSNNAEGSDRNKYYTSEE